VAFIWNFPAGLLVYWITTNLWTIVQQAVVRKRLGPITPPDPVAAAALMTEGDAPPKSGPRGSKPAGSSSGSASPVPEPAVATGGGRKPAPPPPPRRKRKRSGRRR
jgi:YidC/Oxa1 family membrane protein insertase